MRFSIELVPRSSEALIRELATVRRAFPDVDTINVPDLVRFPFRSWHACAVAREQVPHAIPHLRARDFDPAFLAPLKEALSSGGLREVLVVRGDPREDPQVADHPTRSAELIRALKRAEPALTVFAAVDPYRRGMREVLDDVAEKREAGADGLFTQPFFDLRLVELWAEALDGIPVWWGCTPILSSGSRRYWERKNRVVLPRSFEPGIDWSRRQVAELLEWAQRERASCYAMPIRVDLEAWLGGLV